MHLSSYQNAAREVAAETMFIGIRGKMPDLSKFLQGLVVVVEEKEIRRVEQWIPT
jgi:hypothetical protein